jgi:hypothetical protein
MLQSKRIPRWDNIIVITELILRKIIRKWNGFPLSIRHQMCQIGSDFQTITEEGGAQMKIMHMGIDFSTNVFQLQEVDEKEHVVLRKRKRRGMYVLLLSIARPW